MLGFQFHGAGSDAGSSVSISMPMGRRRSQLRQVVGRNKPQHCNLKHLKRISVLYEVIKRLRSLGSACRMGAKLRMRKFGKDFRKLGPSPSGARISDMQMQLYQERGLLTWTHPYRGRLLSHGCDLVATLVDENRYGFITLPGPQATGS